MSLIYCEHLVNVHFGNIPHSFILHFTLHSVEKICSEFSANYPLTTFGIPQSAFRKIPGERRPLTQEMGEKRTNKLNDESQNKAKV